MRYEVFITRRDNWADKGSDITLTEWLSYLSIDKSLQRDALFDSARTRENDALENPTHVIWTDWPGQSDGKEARFRLEDGNVVASDSDEAIRKKLFIMAHVLEGKVQGIEGEIYDANGKALPAKAADKKKSATTAPSSHPIEHAQERKAAEPTRTAPPPQKAWWQFW
ncbi:MAG: hypothetical protein AAFY06_03600 [Pseudomonadota bacterium]